MPEHMPLIHGGQTLHRLIQSNNVFYEKLDATDDANSEDSYPGVSSNTEACEGMNFVDANCSMTHAFTIACPGIFNMKVYMQPVNPLNPHCPCILPIKENWTATP